MSQLNTFGAIMTYAIELEAQLVNYYTGIGDDERTKAADKRRVNLERTRRENVTEIKLEAIDGLDAGDYELNLEDTSEAGQTAVEQTAAQFYADVAPKINVREAQRMLERCGKQHRQLLEA